MTVDASATLGAIAGLCLALAALLRLVGPAWSGPALTWIGWGILTVALVHRGDVSGHWPLTNTYEFLLTFAWALVLVALWLERAHRTRLIGACGLPVAAVLLGYAVAALPATDRLPHPALPALRSIWLQLHVGSSAVAYGAFGVAAALGVLYLVRERWPEADAQQIEQIGYYIYRAVAVGFPWLTASILTGAAWAQTAWGNYWSWDPKETWALVTWLVYLLFLHARVLRGWRGRRVAWLAVLGFAVVLFTFLGLRWLVQQIQLESLHIY